MYPPMMRRPGLERDIARTNFERVLGNAAQMAIILIGIIAAVVALQAAQVVLAPVFLAITVGLMFGPIADLMERRGVPEFVSAAIVVLLLVLIIIGGGLLFYGPLASWAERLPVVWARLQQELANWREPIESLGALQQELQGVLGGQADMAVTVEDNSAMTNIAMLAPAILAQVLVFLVSLYFFLATRDSIRVAILSLCVSRRMRWRTAHAFRDVEQKVSRYLLTISLINLGVGTVVTLLMWAIGMPSPLLWGAMAAVLNYIPFVGQAFMALMLFIAGLGTGGGLAAAVVPVGLYWVVNFVEGNFVSPNLLGRTMTINPFLIFLSIAFWLWAWGPMGGLIAVPSLLVIHSVLTHILPTRTVTPRRERKKLAKQAEEDTVESVPLAMPPEPPAGPKQPGAATV